MANVIKHFVNILFFCNTVYAIDKNASDTLLQTHVDNGFLSGYISGYIESLTDSTSINVRCLQGKTFITYGAVGKSSALKAAEVIKSMTQSSRIFLSENKDTKPSCGNNIIFWFPRSYLFEPLIADPRQISKGITYRFDDDVFGKRVAQLNFTGEALICKVECSNISYQFGIDGGVFALFNMGEPSHGHVADLQNADYFGGLNFQVQRKDLSLRVRFYHISCHIGDDFIGSLLSFPGERDKQLIWLEKLNFIKAIYDPYDAGIIEEITKNSTSLNGFPDNTKDAFIEFEDAAKLMYDTSDVNLNNLVKSRFFLLHKHSWVFSNKPSYEVIDIAFSYYISHQFRLYSCVGLFIRNNPTMDQCKGYIQFGAESALGARELYKGLYIRSVYCVHIVYSDVCKWVPDVTYVYGVDFSTVSSFGNHMRIYLEYHSGYSQEGMFKRGRSSYLNAGIKYHY